VKNNNWKKNNWYAGIKSEKTIQRGSPNTDDMQMVIIDDNTRIFISKNASAEDARNNFLAKKGMKKKKQGTRV
jgi:hypothetical protein